MKLLLSAFLLAMILAGSYSCKHEPAAASPRSDTVWFVMAGQSNMAGRGLVEQQDLEVNPDVLELDTALRPQLKQEPNRVNQGTLAGLDCGLSFGNELLLHLPGGTKVGLIQCSISSTSIQEWLGDSLHSVRLYSNMMHRALPFARSGQLKGILWMQGEANAVSAIAATNYDQYFSQFILNTRRDFGIADLPFYVATLPSWCFEPFTDSVNAGIRKTASQLSRVSLIPTDDLGMRGDNLHLDAAGQRTLGKRLGLAAAGL